MKGIMKNSMSLVLFGFVTSTMSGCLLEEPTSGDDLGSITHAESDISERVTEPEESDEPEACNQCSNCVKYARCRQRALPYRLFSYSDKLAIINSHHAVPGAVAIIDVGNSVGHVAYVDSVSGDRIRISEGNYPYGRCGHRTGTEGELGIVGYFVP